MRRNAVQLRAWELQNFDEEAKAYMGRTIYGQDESKQDSKGSDEALPASDPDDPIPATDELDYKYHDQHFKVSLSRATHSFRRPPVFGPEKVVEDPRVIATHRQMLREVLRLGIVAGLVSSGEDIVLFC